MWEFGAFLFFRHLCRRYFLWVKRPRIKHLHPSSVNQGPYVNVKKINIDYILNLMIVHSLKFSDVDISPGARESFNDALSKTLNVPYF